MPEIVDTFLQFINNNASTFANSKIDITPLQQQIMICSPITPIKYSDPQTAFRYIPIVLLTIQLYLIYEGYHITPLLQ